jgi:2-oxoglutarate ferredoxin oxidoreductase subunit beta
VSRIDFIDLDAEVTAEPAPGEAIDIPGPGGGTMRLRKLHEGYDPTDRIAAMNQVQAFAARGEIATGLLYVDAQAGDMHQALNTVAKPLNALREAELCPGTAVLDKLNASLR